MSIFSKKQKNDQAEEVNQINNRELKEQLADSALAFLLNQKLLEQTDLPGIKVEFGYLLMLKNHGMEALFKVIRDDKVFYFACQQKTLRHVGITEEQFQSVTAHMLDMHVNQK